VGLDVKIKTTGKAVEGGVNLRRGKLECSHTAEGGAPNQKDQGLARTTERTTQAGLSSLARVNSRWNSVESHPVHKNPSHPRRAGCSRRYCRTRWTSLPRHLRSRKNRTEKSCSPEQSPLQKRVTREMVGLPGTGVSQNKSHIKRESLQMGKPLNLSRSVVLKPDKCWGSGWRRKVVEYGSKVSTSSRTPRRQTTRATKHQLTHGPVLSARQKNDC